MILTCNNCEEQIQFSLACIPAEWRDPIASSLCKLYGNPSLNCELDYSFYLCDLPSKWREELVALICKAFTISSCDYDCKQCRNLFCDYLPTWPAEWKEKIQVLVCDIIITKGCPPPDLTCVTYYISSTPNDSGQLYDYSYVDCDEAIQNGQMTQSDTLTVCAIRDTFNISSLFTVLEVTEGCEEVPCNTYSATNIRETGEAGFTYTDCNGQVISVQLEEGAFINFCTIDNFEDTDDIDFTLIADTCIIEEGYFLADRYTCVDDACQLVESDVSVTFGTSYTPVIDTFYPAAAYPGALSLWKIKAGVATSPGLLLYMTPTTTCDDICTAGPCFEYEATNTSDTEEVDFAYFECGTGDAKLLHLDPSETTTFCSIFPILSGGTNVTVIPIGTCG